MDPVIVGLLGVKSRLQRAGKTVGRAFITVGLEVGGECGSDLDCVIRAVGVI